MFKISRHFTNCKKYIFDDIADGDIPYSIKPPTIFDIFDRYVKCYPEPKMYQWYILLV